MSYPFNVDEMTDEQVNKRIKELEERAKACVTESMDWTDVLRYLEPDELEELGVMYKKKGIHCKLP